VPLLRPASARDADFQAAVRALAPDLMLVVSYGELLDQAFLDIAPALNVHGSLLPRHRGASPIQTAILEGDPETGVSIQRIVLALDAGDVVHERRTPIGPDETSGELFERLGELGAEAALEALAQLEAGTATYTPQDPARVTHCRKIKKDAGRIDWSRPTIELQRLVRGMSPWPSAQTYLSEVHGGRSLKVHRARACSDRAGATPGEVLEAGPRFVVATGDGALELLEVQLEGKRALGADELLRGLRLAPGEQLGPTPGPSNTANETNDEPGEG
jgi:methionyl-tRNA formyltransferase